MNISKVLGGLAFAAILGAGMTSCTNEVNGPSATSSNVLVKAPKILAYSNGHYWGQNDSQSTRATDGGITWEPCQTNLIDRSHEREIIEEYLPEKNDNLKEGIQEDFFIEAKEDLNLQFYPVYSQTNTANNLGVFFYDLEGEYHEVIVWENMNPWGLTSSDWLWDEQLGQSIEKVTSQGIQINIPKGYKFGFYWGGTLNSGTTTYYSDSNKNEETYRTDGYGNKLEPEQTSKLHAVTFVLNGKTYLGLEDWTDFDFQDWVFTCDVDLLHTTPAEPEQPTEPEDNCDICGHPSHEGVCDKCTPGSTECNPDNGGNNGNDNGDDNGDVNNNPSSPGHHHTDEVEINLGVDDKGDYKESHLSIHVRAGTDVDVFIPMPLEYVCPADDMAIVKAHFEDQMKHGGHIIGGTQDENGNYITAGLLTHMHYKIGSWYIDLYVEYVEAGVTTSTGEVFEEDGIHVWTSDIDENLIKYLQKHYGDGITFEIWNYYEGSASLPELKEYLDRATVKFLDKLPEYYINAFGSANYAEDKDCTVGIDDSQANNYKEPVEGSHLNGSSHNQIYEKEENLPAPPPVPVY